VILEAHPNIFCGHETKIVPDMLNQLKRLDSNIQSYEKVGIEREMIQHSARLYIYSILNQRNAKLNISNRRICIKDPFILEKMPFMHVLFPKAKFIHMIRDGRAVAYSYSKKLNPKQDKIRFDQFMRHFNVWNSYNQQIDNECKHLGSSLCLQMKYEDLVLNSTQMKHRLVEFLSEKWHSNLLNHEKHVIQETLGKNGWSSNQVVKKIYNDSLEFDWYRVIQNYDQKKLDLQFLKKFHYKI
jgi:protein-tyrosine sulfotransferase